MTYPFPVDAPAQADSGTEIQIQGRFRSRMKSLAPQVKIVAVPNGGKRTAWEKLAASREGLTVGFPDVIVLWDGGCCFMEMKQRTGSLSPAQIDNLNWLARNGFACGVFRSVDTAVAFVKAQGAPFLFELAA
jgi:hypothetical protein